MYIVLSLLLLKVKIFISNPLANIPVFFFPVFELFLFGYLNKETHNTGLMVNFFLVGALLWVIIYRTQQEVTNGLVEEIYSKNLKNILSTRISLSQYMLVLILVSFIKLFVTFTVYVISSKAFFNFSFLSLPQFTPLIFANFMLFGSTLGVLSAGLILRYGIKIQFLSWMTSMILYPFMAIYYSVSVMNWPFNIIAELLPTSYLSNYLRNPIYSGVQNIAIGVFLNIFYAIVAWSSLRMLFKSALRKGVFYFQ